MQLLPAAALLPALQLLLAVPGMVARAAGLVLWVQLQEAAAAQQERGQARCAGAAALA